MRVPLHIVEARRERLRALIRQDGFIPVADICRALKISEATARRDLAAIEADGHITRTYGGALADYNTTFASLGERARHARSAKARIARVAFARVPARGTVFLDAGTTILALARLLARRRAQQLTIVTNSLPIASVLGGAPGVTLHLLGGIFLHRQSTLFGDLAVATLANWQFDAAFLGGEAMSAEGIFNSHAEVVRLQRTVLTHTHEAIFCLDASKVALATPHRVATWPEVTRLVTDATHDALQAAHIILPKKNLLAA
jgi:DeoR/GlpR family transcriptional regulator of sugar metabolism